MLGGTHAYRRLAVGQHQAGQLGALQGRNAEVQSERRVVQPQVRRSRGRIDEGFAGRPGGRASLAGHPSN